MQINEIAANMMKRALALSTGCSVKTYPNPMVGAVIFDESGAVISEGGTGIYGSDHAEIDALKKIDFKAEGLMMAVTLEPCNHFGKTPPCSNAILRSGIKKVFIAKKEENGKACNGACFLVDNGIEVVFLDKFAGAVEKINRFFFKTVRTQRPWITVKAAISKDGYITDSIGSSAHITGHEANVYTHSLRASHMAIAVGANTVNIDNPQLTVREVKGENPQPVIFSRNLSVNLNAEIMKRNPIIIREAVISKALKNLWLEHKINSVLVEGGANLIASFLSENMIDEFHIIASEKSFGQGLKLFDEKAQILFDLHFEISEEKKLGKDQLKVFRHI
ncbi:MAG TPA: bifunctional diaminohydroxyphosphoribosylaminopyrimidine deaminase/5-amino-6-(5-phosphoribosylamino)uracil reductase RibD [bacterium]|nr:bifunctional diaminohydroxyphosphoribosylaminopyrimidine deaminase/5-amino-6-(5-phosphoribosylamino)uracil reductase RibD [bacterium]